MMTLRYLPINAAWVFLFGDSLFRMEHAQMFFPTRKEAVAAARYLDLDVTRKGDVINPKRSTT